MQHSKGHILEVAWSYATTWMRAVNLFQYRLLHELPEDESLFEGKGFRDDVDFHCYLVSINLLRKAIILASKQLDSSGQKELKTKIKEFDNTLPMLSIFRNVGEHFDAYIQQKGFNKNIDSRGLQVYSMGRTRSSYKVNWLGNDIDLQKSTEEAYKLYKVFTKLYKYANYTDKKKG